MDERIEHWEWLYAPDAHYFGIFVTVLFVFFCDKCIGKQSLPLI